MKNMALSFLNAVKDILLGWVPEWVWAIINFWPYIWWSIVVILVISVFHKVYRFGGWPALAASLGAAGVGLGFFLGRKTIKQPTPKASPKKGRRGPQRQRRPTIWDLGNG